MTRLSENGRAVLRAASPNEPSLEGLAAAVESRLSESTQALLDLDGRIVIAKGDKWYIGPGDARTLPF